MNKIAEFQGQHRFLSNFWPSDVMLGNIVYPSVEHAYQAAKSLDITYRHRVLVCNTAGQAKRVGRTAELRADWDKVKLEVMFDLVRQKFADEPLRGWLKATGDAELVEGNRWGDRFWGVCWGQGQNHLGKMIMQVRKEINEADKAEV